MKLRYIVTCCCLLLLSGRGYAQAPLEFIENKGQWGDYIKFKTATQGGDVLLEKDGFRYVLADADNNHKVDYYHHGQTQIKPTLKFHVCKATFEGASTSRFTGERPGKVYYNYFLGNDSSKWRAGIHPFGAVNYMGLYKGIDAHLFTDKGNMAYDLIIHPNADPNQIRIRYEGQDAIQVRNHDLIIKTTVGPLTELKPYAYQYINDEKVEVACDYKLKGNVVTYQFPNDYDHSRQLIIDPIVVFCTLTGSTADNWGFTATYDNAGNFYAGGLVNTINYGGHFPVSPGAFQMTFGGGNTYVDPITHELWAYAADISIIKYDATLSSRVYATYLGGSGNDHAHSMIVDDGGNLIIAGRTISADYPVTAGAFQTTNHGGWDVIVTKLNATCTALVGSTYVGGSGHDGVNYDSTEYGYGELKYNYGDDARSEVLIDKAGFIYVTSCTNSNDFPCTPSTALATTLSGLQDGVVFKLNSTLTAMPWGTYIGGSGSDAGYVLAFDTAQSAVYVGGGTNSTNFPVTAGSYHTTYQGGIADGFVLKFRNSTPYNLLRGTYIGASNYDQVYGLQVSHVDEVYLMGQSLGGLFPVTSGVFSNPGSSQFVMKMDNNLSSDLVSTVFGSGSSTTTNISPSAFLVDTCNNIYISGWGGNLGIPGIASGECDSMPVTPDAAQPTTDGRDFYFIVFGPNMVPPLRYASYYGRNCPTQWEGEHVDGGTSRFSQQGIIYQGICANCGGIYNPTTNPGGCPVLFPTTSGVWSMLDSSINCNEAALKIAFNIGPVTADIIAGPTTQGCAPLLVNFTNLSNNGLSFIWDFGDGSPTTTTFSPSHTFVGSGVYTVTLSASNSNACFRTNDTAHLVITVGTNVIKPGFTTALIDSCGPYVASFTNTSVDTFGSPTYTWYLGDGSTYTGITPPNHTYTDPGTYTVMLIMTDTAACKSPDTVTHVISFLNQVVSAKFSIPDSICLGTSFTPNVLFTNINSTKWTFGDGQTSLLGDPTHLYTAVGSYTVTLVALNTTGCGGGDTLSEYIKVLPVPTANFSVEPTVPIPNVPNKFTNLSVNATRYRWDFGDALTSEEVNPVHQYNKTGVYKPCLTAYNASNCPSKVCKEATADVEPLIGLPTAFSPNGDGENDILYVRGAAISTMDLKIFNRWGQLVFESNSLQKGWDGTFNGQPQPMEAYAYVLNASFIDGTAKMMKGNITLLR